MNDVLNKGIQIYNENYFGSCLIIKKQFNINHNLKTFIMLLLAVAS